MVFSVIIRIIFFITLGYVFVKILKKLFLKPGQSKTRVNSSILFNNSRPINEMVQDPVCKVYVPKTNSLTTVRSGATYYFCSKECLEKFKSEKHEKGAEI